MAGDLDREAPVMTNDEVGVLAGAGFPALAAGFGGAALAVVFAAGALAVAAWRADGAGAVWAVGRAAGLAAVLEAGFCARAGGDAVFFFVAGLAGLAFVAVVLLTGLSSQGLDACSAGGSRLRVAASSAAHCSHVVGAHTTGAAPQARQPSRPCRNTSRGRSMPMNTILLVFFSPGAHLAPRSLPISWCTPWKMTRRSVPFMFSTPL